MLVLMHSCIIKILNHLIKVSFGASTVVQYILVYCLLDLLIVIWYWLLNTLWNNWIPLWYVIHAMWHQFLNTVLYWACVAKSHGDFVKCDVTLYIKNNIIWCVIHSFAGTLCGIIKTYLIICSNMIIDSHELYLCGGLCTSCMILYNVYIWSTSWLDRYLFEPRLS